MLFNGSDRIVFVFLVIIFHTLFSKRGWNVHLIAEKDEISPMHTMDCHIGCLALDNEFTQDCILALLLVQVFGAVWQKRNRFSLRNFIIIGVGGHTIRRISALTPLGTTRWRFWLCRCSRNIFQVAIETGTACGFASCRRFFWRGSIVAR